MLGQKNWVSVVEFSAIVYNVDSIHRKLVICYILIFIFYLKTLQPMSQDCKHPARLTAKLWRSPPSYSWNSECLRRYIIRCGMHVQCTYPCRAGGTRSALCRSASASSRFDRNKSKPCSFRRPCITKCTPIFLDLPTALLLMRAAGNNGWLCGVLQ